MNNQLADRFLNLVLERAIKNFYLSADIKTKEEMKRVFNSGKEEDEKEFLKKNIPESVIKKEMEKLFDELK